MRLVMMDSCGNDAWFGSKEATGKEPVLTVTAEQHPWDGPELHVHDRNDSVLLGEFLNRERERFPLLYFYGVVRDYYFRGSHLIPS